MKRAAMLTVLVATVMAVSLGWDHLFEANEVTAAPPLSLEGLLDEKLPEATETEKLKVDNTSCYVCHGYYDEEHLVLTHGKGGVSCIDCHGKSYEHRDDEDNITPPDKMYAPGAVNKMCRLCHEEHDAPAAKVIARWQQRCPKKTDPKTIVCTDCHFEHRMKRRTIEWDRKTRELLPKKDQPVEKE